MFKYILKLSNLHLNVTVNDNNNNKKYLCV